MVMTKERGITDILSQVLYCMSYSSELSAIRQSNLEGFSSELQAANLSSLEQYIIWCFKVYYKCISNYCLGSCLIDDNNITSRIYNKLSDSLLNTEVGITYGSQSDMNSLPTLFMVLGMACNDKDYKTLAESAINRGNKNDAGQSLKRYTLRLQDVIERVVEEGETGKVGIVLGSTIPALDAQLSRFDDIVGSKIIVGTTRNGLWTIGKTGLADRENQVLMIDSNYSSIKIHAVVCNVLKEYIESIYTWQHTSPYDIHRLFFNIWMHITRVLAGSITPTRKSINEDKVGLLLIADEGLTEYIPLVGLLSPIESFNLKIGRHCREHYPPIATWHRMLVEDRDKKLGNQHKSIYKDLDTKNPFRNYTISSVLLSNLKLDLPNSLVAYGLIGIPQEDRIVQDQRTLIIDSYYPCENAEGHIYIGFNEEEYIHMIQKIESLAKLIFGSKKVALRPRPRVFKTLNERGYKELIAKTNMVEERYELPEFCDDVEGCSSAIVVGYPTSVIWTLMSKRKNWLYLFNTYSEYTLFMQDIDYCRKW